MVGPFETQMPAMSTAWPEPLLKQLRVDRKFVETSARFRSNTTKKALY